MTTNEQAQLSQSFGGVEVDLYGESELRQQLALNQESGTATASPSVPDVLAGLATQAAAEVTGVNWGVAESSYATTSRLFDEMLRDPLAPDIHVPELSEFAKVGVDFAKLRAGYEAYEQAGLKPELVLAPINLPLDTWRSLYGSLRQWQDTNHPDSESKLKQQNDGDGLWVNSSVADNWDNLSHRAIQDIPTPLVIQRNNTATTWAVMVVPTASKEEGGLSVNTSHDLSKDNVSPQMVALTGLAGLNEKTAHMPTGAYLTLQALHVQADTPLIDKDTYTWNAGSFQEGNNLRAPFGHWNADSGQVCVRHVGVGASDDNLGVRLPVWG